MGRARVQLSAIATAPFWPSNDPARKFQNPTQKFQGNLKYQEANSKAGELGIWSSFGILRLEFGVSARVSKCLSLIHRLGQNDGTPWKPLTSGRYLCASAESSSEPTPLRRMHANRVAAYGSRDEYDSSEDRRTWNPETRCQRGGRLASSVDWLVPGYQPLRSFAGATFTAGQTKPKCIDRQWTVSR